MKKNKIVDNISEYEADGKQILHIWQSQDGKIIDQKILVLIDEELKLYKEVESL